PGARALLPRREGSALQGPARDVGQLHLQPGPEARLTGRGELRQGALDLCGSRAVAAAAGGHRRRGPATRGSGFPWTRAQVTIGAMEVPLTPLELARRTRTLYADREAMVDGDLRLTYAQFFERCDRWSAALQRLGVRQGDRVAYIAPNTHAQLESFYAV